MKESLETFRENFVDRKSLITQVIHTDGEKKMMVYYEEDEKIKQKNLQDFLILMHKQSIFEGILVYKKEITSSARKVYEKYINIYMHIYYRLLKTLNSLN